MCVMGFWSNQSEQTCWFYNQSGAKRKPIVIAFSRAWHGRGLQTLPSVLIGSLLYSCLLWLAFGFGSLLENRSIASNLKVGDAVRLI